MNADERRFIAWAYIAHVRLFLSAAPCKNQGASLQSAQSPQRDGGVGGEGKWVGREKRGQKGRGSISVGGRDRFVGGFGVGIS